LIEITVYQYWNCGRSHQCHFFPITATVISRRYIFTSPSSSNVAHFISKIAVHLPLFDRDCAGGGRLTKPADVVSAQGFDVDANVQALFERLVLLDIGPFKHHEPDKRDNKRKTGKEDVSRACADLIHA
jgi:hypothetical protein